MGWVEFTTVRDEIFGRAENVWRWRGGESMVGRTGHNLLVRPRDYQHDALRFIADFAVPFTNNQAEQDLRMMKVRMKISGAFRAIDGARTFAAVRSVISTARKHGLNILETLTQPPDGIITQLQR